MAKEEKMSEELRNGKYEDEYGEVYWYKDGERLREDGPAIEGLNGYREWWVAGQLHREDGPAIMYGEQYKAWYIRNRQKSEQEFNDWVAKNKEQSSSLKNKI